MRLEWFELRDFRNHRSTKPEPPEGTVALVGPNGEGKTNLLEGVFFLLNLYSPRVSSDASLIRTGCESAILRGEVLAGGAKILIEVEIKRSGANRVQVNRSAVRRKQDLRKQVSSAFFGPHDLRVVMGDPAARRDFLDEVVRSLWPPKDAASRTYDKVLRQRNRLLKDRVGMSRPRDLDTWNEALADAGTILTKARSEAVEAIALLVDQEFRGMAGYGLEVAYLPNIEGDVAAFLVKLAEREADELSRGVTLVGPHRDDLHVGVRDLTVRTFASHGEAWAAALSLRLGQAGATQVQTGEAPILLLDDPFSALDPRRRDQLAARLKGRGQVLISVADEADIPVDADRVWDVVSGAVEERRTP